jgi:hypothetical protein
MHTGTHLSREKLKPICQRFGFGFVHFGVGTQREFLQAMQVVHNECLAPNRPVYPIIHFEMHGLPDETGLVVAPSKEIISWADFVRSCRQINVACDNSLTCVLAVCHGFTAIMQADITQPTPFCALIGSEERVTAGEILQRFSFFYEQLFQGDDLLEALKALGDGFGLYDCQYMFTDAFTSYWREHCRGRGKGDWVEQIVTRAKQRFPGLSLRRIRKTAKKEITPTERIFERFKSRFLMSDIGDNGTRFPITFADIRATID